MNIKSLPSQIARIGMFAMSLSIATHFLAAETFLVINTMDSGPGSLRQAILDANKTPERDKILFSIPEAGPHTIRPLSLLPIVSAPLVIDGTTQPGFADSPRVEISGELIANPQVGINIRAGLSIVRGLAINRFGSTSGEPGAQILLETGGSNVVERCYVGLGVDGSTFFAETTDPDQPNGRAAQGVFILNSADNLIGGFESSSGNVISGQGINVRIKGGNSFHNYVLRNLIGMDASGSRIPESSFRGVFIDSADRNNIGDGVDLGNVISGGVFLSGSSYNLISGNLVGTNPEGNAVLSDLSRAGISISSGGTNVISHNVIAGAGSVINPAFPIGAIDLLGTARNVVVGNKIGTDRNGILALGNYGPGILISFGGSRNDIGGTYSYLREENIIAHGRSSGVEILGPLGVGDPTPTGNVVRENKIKSNAGLAIELSERTMADREFIRIQGLNVNDLLDMDENANGMQNHPVLTLAENNGVSLIVSGELMSKPNTKYLIDLYSGDRCGDAEEYLGGVEAETDDAGRTLFRLEKSTVLAVGKNVTATATDIAGMSTSEFGPCIAVSAATTSPILRLSRSVANPGKLILSWEPNFVGYSLEVSSDPAGAAWAKISNVSGNSYEFVPNTMGFFRLAK